MASGETEGNSQIHYNQSMVSATELGTLINPAFLKDLVMSAYKEVIDLLIHNTHSAVQSPTMQVRARIPELEI